MKKIEDKTIGLMSAKPVSTGVCAPQTIPTAPPYCVTWVHVCTSSAFACLATVDNRLTTISVVTRSLFILIRHYTLEYVECQRL